MKSFELTQDMVKKVKKGKIDPQMKKMMKSMNLDNISEDQLEEIERKFKNK